MHAAGITLQLRCHVRSQHVGMHLVSHLHPRCAQRMVGSSRGAHRTAVSAAACSRRQRTFESVRKQAGGVFPTPSKPPLGRSLRAPGGGAAASQQPQEVRPPPGPPPTLSRCPFVRTESATPLDLCRTTADADAGVTASPCMSCAGRRVGGMARVAEGCCWHARRSCSYHVGNGSTCPGRGFRRAVCQKVQAGHAGDAGPPHRQCPHDCHAAVIALQISCLHCSLSHLPSLFHFENLCGHRAYAIYAGGGQRRCLRETPASWMRQSWRQSGSSSRIHPASSTSATYVRPCGLNSHSGKSCRTTQHWSLADPAWFRRAGEVRARQGRFGAMDIVKMPVGAGSGFIWDDQGHIVRILFLLCRPATPTNFLSVMFPTSAQVTNNHVIQGADDVQVSLIDQSVYNAKVGTERPIPQNLIKIACFLRQ